MVINTNPYSGRDQHRKRVCQGQAMIELTIGLVSLIAVIATIAQLAVFVRARHEAANRARRDAGSQALQALPYSVPPAYIGSTDVGPDGIAYSRDDQFNATTPVAYQREILQPLAADASDWTTLEDAPANPFTRMVQGEPPSGIFGLLRGEHSERVLLLPAVRNLLYAQDSITIEETVWMTWTQGVY